MKFSEAALIYTGLRTEPLREDAFIGGLSPLACIKHKLHLQKAALCFHGEANKPGSLYAVATDK